MRQTSTLVGIGILSGLVSILASFYLAVPASDRLSELPILASWPLAPIGVSWALVGLIIGVVGAALSGSRKGAVIAATQVIGVVVFTIVIVGNDLESGIIIAVLSFGALVFGLLIGGLVVPGRLLTRRLPARFGPPSGLGAIAVVSIIGTSVLAVFAWMTLSPNAMTLRSFDPWWLPLPRDRVTSLLWKSGETALDSPGSGAV